MIPAHIDRLGIVRRNQDRRAPVESDRRACPPSLARAPALSRGASAAGLSLAGTSGRIVVGEIDDVLGVKNDRVDLFNA